MAKYRGRTVKLNKPFRTSGQRKKFAVYVRNPSANDFKVRDTCGKLNSSFQITGEEALKKLKLTKLSNYDDRSLANYYCDGYFGLN